MIANTLLTAAACVIGFFSWTSAAQSLDRYSPVTDDRLLNPEPQNWLMYRGTYNGFGYSPLDKINTQNVKKLAPVWSFSTGMLEGHQAPPIVNNGVMFVTTPNGQVLALDAKNGDLLWRYVRELPEDVIQAHPTNRGVALFEDKVYVATVDAHLAALDAKTGKVVWDVAVDDYKKAYYLTLAPLVAKGKVMVGTSGGEFGIRGYVAAFDARTGKEVWKTYTIPGPGEPGNETWAGDTWKTGGASVWITGHYRCGSPDTTIRSSTSPIGEQVTAGLGRPICILGTASTPLPWLHWTRIPANSRATTSTIGTTTGTGMKSPRRC